MATNQPTETATPDGVEIKLKREGAQPWHEHHLLESDGFGKTYQFTPANGHKVQMDPADVEVLRARGGGAHFILPRAAE